MPFAAATLPPSRSHRLPRRKSLLLGTDNYPEGRESSINSRSQPPEPITTVSFQCKSHFRNREDLSNQQSTSELAVGYSSEPGLSNFNSRDLDMQHSGMEASANNEQQPAIEAGPPFHPYSRLPPELKLLVWKFYFQYWSPGAHRFELSADPNHNRQLISRPDGSRAKDASAWRERHAFGRIDIHSFDIFLEFERRAMTVYWEYTSKSRRHYNRALIDRNTDLVTFRFHYGETRASIAILDASQNAPIFKGVIRVGLEMDYFSQGFKGQRQYLPFGCSCQTAEYQWDCRIPQICQFIRYFKDLETLYIIFPISVKSGMNKMIDPQFMVALQEDPATWGRKAAIDLFLHLDQIRQAKGLEQFHDRSGTYCQIVREDTERLSKVPIWDYLRQFQQLYSQHNHRQPVQFKFLVWIDLRNETLGGQHPLRTAAPWRC
ncbi:hypothetical protein F5Y07DRAFT_413320 [Xylaria sp. FL0933]|nr:hypothetical protein F5Y07DRAFT_413320 [Xylaria sp. FL0933]